jgi:membrane associated rhomboid family serine protease
MGLYDREYYRGDEGPSGYQFSTRMMVTNLVILNAALWLLDLFLGRQHWLVETLAVTPDVLAKPWLWWKFLTYGFAHDPATIGHVFWNMVGLWIFGRDVEAVYGPKEFLRIYLTALVLGSMVWCVREQLDSDGGPLRPLLGASGAVTAVILLYVFHYPHRTVLLMFVLPVPAWVLGVLMIGGDVVQLLTARDRAVAFDVHLVGAAFAVAYYRLGWNLGRFLPQFGFARSAMSKLKPTPKLKIHDPGEDAQQDEEADRILEKVSREGLDSLSGKERRILEDYSRRMRHKYH